MSGRLAVIDLGTNTARLLIADRSVEGDFRQVYLRREVVRMGGGFSRTVGLSREAMQRGLSCLVRFSEAIRRHDAPTVLAVATSAVRDAANGAEFVGRVKGEAGIDLRVIDGIVEGTLTLAGVMAGLDRPCDEALVLDIGGGSTEYTLARQGRVHYVRSLPLGVVRLTEGKGTVAAMERKIRKELGLLFHDMGNSGCIPGTGVPLIGTAGTATTLAAISMEMEDYDYRKINNSILSRMEVESIFERLLPMTPEERLRVPGLEKGREDLIVAGILMVLETMELFGVETMRVSDYGLLEGLVVRGEALVERNGA